MENFKHIAVLMGGTSSERDISLQSGEMAFSALESLGLWKVSKVILNEDSISAMPDDVDCAFLALHGGWGESGGVQAALDARGIAYTGPGAEASRLAMDKSATKAVLIRAGIPTPAWRDVPANAAAGMATPPFNPPFVVKPPHDGSSVGISLVRDIKDFRPALNLAFKADGRSAMIEEYIPGREFTIGILPDGRTLPAIEIVAQDGWYGWEAKYQRDDTRYLFTEEDFLPQLERTAKTAYNACGCRGITRIDFRVTPEGREYVLELNTLPGLTAHSLIPKAAAHVGISFAELCRLAVERARHD